MDNEQFEREVSRKSMRIYLPIALGAGLLFGVVSTLTGKYLPVAIVGGTVWVSLLSLIVSMPLVISRVKKQLK